MIPPRRRRQKKEIKYAPAPNHLVAAIRKELRRLVEEKDLDGNLGMISRFADKADEMLMMIKAPEAVMRDEHTFMGSAGPSVEPNVETYGASIIRQIAPVLQGYYQAQRETPESLTYAIATARRAGMTDLAAELEKKLVGKPLDGARPINNGASATMNEYLNDAVPATEKIDLKKLFNEVNNTPVPGGTT